MLEILLVIAALIAFDLVAVRFGVDSRPLGADHRSR
jgi:hypothetical protein